MPEREFRSIHRLHHFAWQTLAGGFPKYGFGEIDGVWDGNVTGPAPIFAGAILRRQFWLRCGLVTPDPI